MGVSISTLTSELVGRRYPEYKFVVDQGWVENYCKSLGYKAPHTVTIVPKTFISCFRDSEFKALEDLGIDLSQLLHAHQNYKFKEDMEMGDQVTGQTMIRKLFHRRGKAGAMVMLEFHNEFKLCERNGVAVSVPRVIIESTATVVVRDAVAKEAVHD